MGVEGAAGVGEEIENEGDSQILGISPDLKRETSVAQHRRT